MREILYTLAFDEARKLVTAKDAIKGHRYWCANCNAEMISRRSIEQKKGAKRPHYAHKPGIPPCDPETALHIGFKLLLFERIKAHIEAKQPLRMTWHCKACLADHECDLLNDIGTVALEKSIGPCRPDLALMDGRQKVQWAIEVVVSHKPELETIRHYQSEVISLVQFDLKDDTDLERAMNTPLAPDLVAQCIGENCTLCGTLKRNDLLWVVDGTCTCRGRRKVCFGEGPDSLTGPIYFPSKFTADKIRLAEEHGASFKRTERAEGIEEGLSNYCPKCGLVDQTKDLINTYVLPAKAGRLNSVQLVVGNFCASCTAKELAVKRGSPKWKW